MFGLNITDEMKDGREILRYWGARAIFKGGTIDLLPDRQTFQGPEQDQSLERQDFNFLSFVWWVNNTALPWLREEVKNLGTDSGKIVEFGEGRFFMAASPQSSHGYLYIGAVEFVSPTARYDLAERPADKQWTGQFEPQLGQRVKINFNGFGEGSIASFFWEHDYAGVRVRLDNQPDWHKKQGQPPYALVFGAEVAPV